MTVVFTGMKEVLARLKSVKEETAVAAAFGSYEGLQEIMVDAKSRTPVDTSTLKDSGYVTPPEVRGGHVVALEAGFGGDASGYAARVHEDLEMYHAQGEAKFLEKAVDAGRANLVKAIQKHVRNFLRSGRTRTVPKKVPATPWGG